MIEISSIAGEMSAYIRERVINAPPPPEPKPVEYRHLESLGELDYSHLPAAKQGEFRDFLANIRALRYQPDFSGLILASEQVGIGKTHIAKSIANSFSYLTQSHVIQRHKFFVAPELINPQDGNFDLSVLTPPRPIDRLEILENQNRGVKREPVWACIVIDDVGREGHLPYVKAEHQREEIQSRYFQVINAIYSMNPRPVLVMTTNIPLNEFKAFFNAAAWSRLSQMVPAGHILQMPVLPDYREIQGGRG